MEQRAAGEEEEKRKMKKEKRKTAYIRLPFEFPICVCHCSALFLMRQESLGDFFGEAVDGADVDAVVAGAEDAFLRRLGWIDGGDAVFLEADFRCAAFDFDNFDCRRERAAK